MNRVIKFRAYHKVNKTMEYEGWNKYKNGNETYCSKTTLFMYGEDAEIMQFTNLTDKNGVEIYEGDVVRNWQGGWNVVVYKAPGFEATVSENESSLYTEEWWRSSEVIGNIYENPELLNP